jgi:hypothetical protein
VLDAGASDGALARRLADRVDQVDVVGTSAVMHDAGRRRPGGRQPNLVWLLETAENLPVHRS